MRTARIVLGVVGVTFVLIGAFRLIGEDVPRLVSLALWLAGGVLVHDVVLAPLTLLVVAIGTRVVPPPARTAAVVGLLVWGTVTIAVANVLLGVGGRPDNPTLLERPYLAWWSALTAAWWLCVVVVGVLALRRRRAA